MTTPDYNYKYLATAATTQVATGRSFLHAIIVGTTAAGTIKVIDHISGSTVNVAELKDSVADGTYVFNCVMKAGIRIIASANTKFTVIYSTP